MRVLPSVAAVAICASCHTTGVRPDDRPTGFAASELSSSMPYYSSAAAARAAGLRPLESGGDQPQEIRVWIGGGIGIPNSLYRFVRTGDRVDGEVVLHWPANAVGEVGGRTAETATHELMRYSLRGRCDRWVLRSDAGICRMRFRTTPPWSRLLVQLEAAGIWDLPDESAEPRTSIVLDGWGMSVELWDHDRYRSYSFSNPDAQRGAAAKRAATIAADLRAIDSLSYTPDVVQRYRGLTTGRLNSGFRPCDSSETWSFDANLRTVAAASKVPVPGDETDTTSTYYVELTGEIAPDWVARDWGSAFEKTLEVLKVHRVERAGVVACAHRGD